MQKIFISLSAFSDKGNDEELTKFDLRKHAPVPNIPNLETPKTFKAIFPKFDMPKSDKTDDDNEDTAKKYLSDLNKQVAEAALEIGKQPDRRTRYQLRRVARMSVRYENNTMPNENI